MPNLVALYFISKLLVLTSVSCAVGFDSGVNVVFCFSILSLAAEAQSLQWYLLRRPVAGLGGSFPGVNPGLVS